MAIRVLRDHGVPEHQIIFLTFLIARRGLHSVRSAFPAVRIVTASIDPGLHEMHFPLSGLLLGEASGEGDYAARFAGADDPDEVEDEEEEEDAGKGDSGLRDAVMSTTGLQIEKRTVEGGRHDLRFSRKKQRDETQVTEKRAWVVSPGEWLNVVRKSSLMQQAWGILGESSVRAVRLTPSDRYYI